MESRSAGISHSWIQPSPPLAWYCRLKSIWATSLPVEFLENRCCINPLCPHNTHRILSLFLISFCHNCFPVTIQINSDQIFRLNLFLFHLQHIAILDEFPSQRLWHECLRRPSIEPVRRHIVLNTFGSCESRDFRTRKNPSVNRFSLAVSSLPHIPLSVHKGERSRFS